jgi:hypothetical protein
MKTAISLIMFAHPLARHNSAQNGEIFITFNTEYFKKSVEKIQVLLYSNKNLVSLKEITYIFLLYLAEHFESFRGSQNSNVMLNICFINVLFVR